MEPARNGDCTVAGNQVVGGAPDELAGARPRPPESGVHVSLSTMSPHLLQINYGISKYRVTMLPAVARVICFAATAEAQGIELIEIAQWAIDEGALGIGDAEADQLVMLDEWTQQLSGKELAWMRSPVACGLGARCAALMRSPVTGPDA